mmetsp:Transcript_531/g.1271  ORF Transcript_531/g.1271 Transcript_531/m.1271 type:complete len:81 (-) Transcript_531:17-259(-)
MLEDAPNPLVAGCHPSPAGSLAKACLTTLELAKLHGCNRECGGTKLSTGGSSVTIAIIVIIAIIAIIAVAIPCTAFVVCH